MTNAAKGRVLKELQKLNQDPPPGVAVWPNDDGSISTLGASNDFIKSLIKSKRL